MQRPERARSQARWQSGSSVLLQSPGPRLVSVSASPAGEAQMYRVRSEMPAPKSPRILVTLAVAAEQARPDLSARRGELYLEALRRHGGGPVAGGAGTSAGQLAPALGAVGRLRPGGGRDP